MLKLSSEDNLNAIALERFSTLTPNVEAFITSINAFLSITAFLGNVFILVALYRVTSISPPTKVLFVSLAVTDLLTGLISRPLFAVHSIPRLVFSNPSLSYYSEQLSGVSGFILNAISVLALSVDRLLAQVLGLAHRAVVTLRRVRPIVFWFWLLSIMSGGWRYAAVGSGAARMGFITFSRLCLMTVSSIAWIQLKLLFCCIPCIIVGKLFTYKRMPPSIAGAVPFRVSVSVLYLNSSLNPILYVWKIREVKNIVKAEIRPLKCC